MASLVDWFLKEQGPSHARAAIAAMRAQQPTGLAPRDAYCKALADLNGDDAILAGYLSDGGDERVEKGPRLPSTGDAPGVRVAAFIAKPDADFHF